MRRSAVRTIRRLLREQRRSLDRLARMIPLLERENSRANAGRGRTGKRLVCEKCDRRFALPMHLGRHLAMSHRRKRTT